MLSLSHITILLLENLSTLRMLLQLNERCLVKLSSNLLDATGHLGTAMDP